MIELSKNISDYIESLLGPDYLSSYKSYIETDYIPYLRFAVPQYEFEKLFSDLEKQNIELSPVPNISNAFRIVKGSEFAGKTLEFTLGKYYIQSLSSMIPPLVLNPNENDVIMDLCAAPGSKSTQLADLMNYKGTLYANEPSLTRIKALVHNLDKMNSLNIGVTQNKGETLSKYFENYFDKILVDAPCSALGIVQKKNEVSNWWTTNQAEKIASLQLKLLISAIKMVKVGGEIVYSTCTLTLEENELVINKVLQKYPVELEQFDLPVPSHDGICEFDGLGLNETIKKTKRIVPWELNSEGFFVAKLVKTGKTEQPNKVYLKSSKYGLTSAKSPKIKKYIKDVSDHFGIPEKIFDGYKFLIKANDIYFVNSEWKEFNIDFFLRVGTRFGIIDKTNSLRLHSHAAQILGKYAAKNVCTLENQNELATYFSGSSIKRIDKIRGQKIVKFGEHFLGTGVSLEGEFKSQFPRSKRTHDIIFS